MADVKNSVWVGELDRFGYTLTVVANTEKEVKDALMRAFEKAFRDLNNDADPRDHKYGENDKSYYDEAFEDINYRELPFGRVEWR